MVETNLGWEGLCLVDAGATECVVPGQHLGAIGFMPERQRTHTLVDGNEISMDIAPVREKFMGAGSANPLPEGKRTYRLVGRPMGKSR